MSLLDKLAEQLGLEKKNLINLVSIGFDFKLKDLAVIKDLKKVKDECMQKLAELQELQNNSTELAEKLAKAEREIKELEDEKLKLTKDLNTAVQKVKEYEATNTNTYTRIQTLIAENKKNKTSMQTYITSAETEKNEKKKLSAELVKAKSIIQTIQETNAELKRKNDALEARINNAKSEVAQELILAQERIANMTDKETVLTRGIYEAKQELVAKEKTIETIQGNRTQEKQLFANKVKELLEKIASIQKANNTLAKELSATKVKATQEKQTLIQKLQTLQKTIQQNSQLSKIHKLEQKIQKLNTQLQKCSNYRPAIKRYFVS